jgi:hypothetical protein
VIEIVAKTDPARPSARSEDSPTPAATIYTRGRLKGDLDAIILKTMSKEPERRYGSAGELADDLERFLIGQPVVARAPSVGYVLRKLARRNKLAVGIAAASLVAIVGAMSVAMWQRTVALNERGHAEQRFNETRRLANALIFKIHDAVAPMAGSTPVRQTIVNEALACFAGRASRPSRSMMNRSSSSSPLPFGPARLTG